jgi:hypothetical protein
MTEAHLTEWLKLMLEEIERKGTQAKDAREEERRRQEPDPAGTSRNPIAAGPDC